MTPDVFRGWRARRERAAYRDVNRRSGPQAVGRGGMEPRRAAEPLVRPPAGDDPAIPFTDDSIILKSWRHAAMRAFAAP